MAPDELNEDPAPDFSPDTWITSSIETALNDFISVLYEEGVGVAKTTINLAHMPGDPITLQTDYGTVEFTGEEAR